MILATQSCVQEFADTDLARLDLVPGGFDGRADFLGSMVKCGLEFAKNPDLAISTIDELLRNLGISATQRHEFLGRVRNSLDRIAPTAKKIAGALAVGSALANAWDNVFDSLAQGPMTVALTGTAADIAPLVGCGTGCSVTGRVPVEHPATSMGTDRTCHHCLLGLVDIVRPCDDGSDHGSGRRAEHSLAL